MIEHHLAGSRRFLLPLLAAASVGACSDRPDANPIAPASASARLATKSPSFSSFIVVMKPTSPVLRSRIGTPLNDVLGAPGKSMPGRIVSALPHLNAIVVSGVSRAADLAGVDGVVSVIPNYEHNIIDPSPATGLDAIVESEADAAPSGTNQSTAGFFANNTQWSYKRIQANRAWVPSRGGKGAKVCIVDSGIDAGHQAFIGKDIVSTSMLPNSSPVDSNFHGSHVAGTISTNGSGAASVAPDASLMTAKVFNADGGGATTDRVLGAVQWCADHGADVINMSLGFTGGVPRAGNEGFIAFYQAGLDYATNLGVLIVAAAGNDGVQLPNASNAFLPAELNFVVSVAATAPQVNPGVFPTPTNGFANLATWQAPDSRFDAIASYSNRGPVPSVDVSAPGGDRLAASWPAQTLIISPCSRFYASAAGPGPCAAGNLYIYAAGTSMASPHVAGVAALIRARFPNTPRSPYLRNRIEACIYKTVDNVGSTNTFGRGRVNAYRATTTPC